MVARWRLLLVGFWFGLAAAGIAALPVVPPFYTADFDAANHEWHILPDPNVAVYYIVEDSADLTDFTPHLMELGAAPVELDLPFTLGLSKSYFRVKRIALYEPQDTDGDGMDDVWELEHSYLNPLDPSDALHPSPNFPAQTNLDEYRNHFALGSAKPQFYSREVSLFNFGGESSAAVSREVSLFNFGSPPFSIEALSREVSLFNGEAPPIAGYPQLYSREVSLFNFGSPPHSVEALSREVSVFNGEAPPIDGYPQIYSREVSVFNFGAAYYSVEAISREVSVFNDIN